MITAVSPCLISIDGRSVDSGAPLTLPSPLDKGRGVPSASSLADMRPDSLGDFAHFASELLGCSCNLETQILIMLLKLTRRLQHHRKNFSHFARATAGEEP